MLVRLRSNENLLIGSGPGDAARLAADTVVEALGGDGHQRSVALAGGSTPRLLYATLVAPPYRDRVDWQSVEWFWGDERTVPPEHPDSNARMARDTLLRPIGAFHSLPSSVHPMPADAEDLDAAAWQYERTIREIVPASEAEIPLLDLVLLGVGRDGHTASLFPGTAALNESKRLVVPNSVPEQRAWRMTMTYPLLMAARSILFFVAGQEKAEVMGRILSTRAGVGSADPTYGALDVGSADPTYPAARLRDAPGRVIWVLDREAARFVVASSTP